MRKQYTIKGVNFAQGELLLSLDEEISFEKIKATDQMLVDSDAFSFIYIIELDEEYTYMVLPENVWPDLRRILIENIPVFLLVDESKIKLPNIHNELHYLIENIKGNKNYGEEMVQKVESAF